MQKRQALPAAPGTSGRGEVRRVPGHVAAAAAQTVAAAEQERLHQRVAELEKEMAFRSEELAEARRRGERMQGRLRELEAAQRNEDAGGGEGSKAAELARPPGVPAGGGAGFSCGRFREAGIAARMSLSSVEFFLEENRGEKGQPSASPSGVCDSIRGLARDQLDAPLVAAHIIGLLLARGEALAAADKGGSDGGDGGGGGNGGVGSARCLLVLRHALPVLEHLMKFDLRIRDGMVEIFLGPSAVPRYETFKHVRVGVRKLSRVETCPPARLLPGGERGFSCAPLTAFERALAEEPGDPCVRAGALRCLRAVLANAREGSTHKDMARAPEWAPDFRLLMFSEGGVLATVLQRRAEDPGAAVEAALVIFHAAQRPELLDGLLLEGRDLVLGELAGCLRAAERTLRLATLRVFEQAVQTCLAHRPDDLPILLLGCCVREADDGRKLPGLARILVQMVDDGILEGLSFLLRLVEGPKSGPLALEDLCATPAVWILSNAIGGGGDEGVSDMIRRVQQRVVQAAEFLDE